MSGNMTKGKFQAVVIIIIALLIIAVVCSWLINRDSKNVEEQTPVDPARVEITSAEGVNYSSDSNGNSNNTQGTSYTGTAPAGTGSTNNGGNTTTNNGGNTTNNGGNTTNNGGNTAEPTPDVGTVSTPAGTDPTVTPDPYAPTPIDPDQTTTGDDGTATEIIEQVVVTPTPEGTTTVGGVPPTDPGYGRSLGSASYSSNVSNLIGITANVSAETVNATQVKVTVTVNVNSYSLYLAPAYDSVRMAVNGTYTTCPGPDLNYPTNKYDTHELATQSFIIECHDGSSLTIPIAIEWFYGGYYSRQYYDTFECGGNFTITRA